MKIASTTLLVCTVCALTPGLPAQSESPETKSAPSTRDRIYYLQHKILPNWTFQSGGAFFRDLKSGAIERLQAAARDFVGEEFARAVKLDAKTAEHAVLITFPPPTEMALCYAVAVVQTDGAYAYYTLELTEDFMNTGAKTVLGGWSEDGAHQNYGTRTYVDPAEFLQEVLAMQKDAAADASTKAEKR